MPKKRSGITEIIITLSQSMSCVNPHSELSTEDIAAKPGRKQIGPVYVGFSFRRLDVRAHQLFYNLTSRRAHSGSSSQQFWSKLQRLSSDGVPEHNVGREGRARSVVESDCDGETRITIVRGQFDSLYNLAVTGLPMTREQSKKFEPLSWNPSWCPSYGQQQIPTHEAIDCFRFPVTTVADDHGAAIASAPVVHHHAHRPITPAAVGRRELAAGLKNKVSQSRLSARSAAGLLSHRRQRHHPHHSRRRCAREIAVGFKNRESTIEKLNCGRRTSAGGVGNGSRGGGGRIRDGGWRRWQAGLVVGVRDDELAFQPLLPDPRLLSFERAARVTASSRGAFNFAPALPLVAFAGAFFAGALFAGAAAFFAVLALRNNA
ncbi:hypothetical protein B0H13DRAFT_1900303 [Mycena leptocephala]|nr:hypothetical protein B0H13DRAFT_1900303 [Mycena leptocephala]